jgi:hypothetical protein
VAPAPSRYQVSEALLAELRDPGAARAVRLHEVHDGAPLLLHRFLHRLERRGFGEVQQHEPEQRDVRSKALSGLGCREPALDLRVRPLEPQARIPQRGAHGLANLGWFPSLFVLICSSTVAV